MGKQIICKNGYVLGPMRSLERIDRLYYLVTVFNMMSSILRVTGMEKKYVYNWASGPQQTILKYK